MKEERPWGYYEVFVDAEDHKVKRITVYPGQRLSLQRHQKRSEYWLFLKGEAVVYGTDESSPTTFVEGSDYNILYFGQGTVGTNYGKIYRVGTNIGTNETVRIDYRFKPDQIFYNNDYRLWGEQNEEVRK